MNEGPPCWLGAPLTRAARLLAAVRHTLHTRSGGNQWGDLTASGLRLRLVDGVCHFTSFFFGRAAERTRENTTADVAVLKFLARRCYTLVTGKDLAGMG